MNKICKLGMLFNENDIPDFGSIQKKTHSQNIYCLLAEDIPKLNGMLTRTAAESYLLPNQSFNLFPGALAFVVDYKQANSGKIYAYHHGRDHWYEFNIPSSSELFDFMWNRHAQILRETKEISGTSPLTFKSNGRALKNYRIYGNTVNGANVGNLVTGGQHDGEYLVPVTIEGKNFLKNTASSRTIGRNDNHPETYPGITFTVNDNGSITCNGVSEENVFYEVDILSDRNFPVDDDKEYYLSGAPSDGGATSYMLRYIDSNGMVRARDTGNGCIFKYTQPGLIEIRIASGYICNNLTFCPMIRRSDIADDTYEPYREPVTVNIYLSEPIRTSGNNDEYIDYSEQKQHFADGTSQDVVLPGLPSFTGTNILTVETDVQPPEVRIRGKLKSV